MWLLSLVLAGVFVLVVHYGLSYVDSGPSDRRISMPIVALVAIFVLAAVGGVVALEVGDGPSPLAFPSGGTPTATPQASTPTPAPTPSVSPTATPQASTPTPTPANASTTLVHVTDADTLTVRRPDGRLETYTLAGVDAPETSGNDPRAFEGVLTGSRGRACLAEFGRRATVFLRTTYLDRPVDVSTVADGSRERAYVSVGGTSLNRLLVARGYAKADGGYAPLEARVRAGDVGLWSCGVVTAPPTDDDGVAITKVHPNPDGDDGATLDGEYFVVENVGSVTVHLGNWYLVVDGRRYGFFSPGELLPGQEVTVHAGSGRDTPTDRYLGANAPLLDNDHATIVLRDGDNVRNVSVSY